jgi:hypothetical protein
MYLRLLAYKRIIPNSLQLRYESIKPINSFHRISLIFG